MNCREALDRSSANVDKSTERADDISTFLEKIKMEIIELRQTLQPGKLSCF